MSEAEARTKVMAVAYTVASELGWREAIKLLQEAASRIEAEQWPTRGTGR